MRNFCKALALAAWFFQSELALDFDNAFNRAVIGPFSSEKNCEAVRLSYIQTAEMLGVTAKISKCVNKQLI